MARFRVESVLDPQTGLYFNELYYPHDSEVPMTTSPPIYHSFESAELGVVEILKKAMPEQPISIVSRG